MSLQWFIAGEKLLIDDDAEGFDNTEIHQPVIAFRHLEQVQDGADQHDSMACKPRKLQGLRHRHEPLHERLVSSRNGWWRALIFGWS